MTKEEYVARNITVQHADFIADKKKIDRDGYAIDSRFPTHANENQIAEMSDLFRHTQFATNVDSDYNYANTPESFSVTFHDLNAEQVRRLADLLS